MKRVFEMGSVILTGGAVLFMLWNTGRGGVIASTETDITKPSPYTLEQINEALRGVGAEPMVGLGHAFKKAEEDHGINAIFLTAIAVHESNGGTSRIAREKNNLFGWGAVDATPFDSAYRFGSWEEGIGYVASRIRALYVDAWGLKTPESIGERYASDSGWAVKVTNWARRLQNEI